MRKFLVCLLSAVIGGWFIFDGCHVLITGRYIGPPQPGPWSQVVRIVGVDPFALGIPFVILGVIWLLACVAVFFHLKWGRTLAAAIALASLWYAPVGTAVSLIVIATLLTAKKGFDT